MHFARHRIEFYAYEAYYHGQNLEACRRILEAARREGGDRLAQAVAVRVKEAVRTGRPPALHGRAASRWRKTAFADAGDVARREAGGGTRRG